MKNLIYYLLQMIVASGILYGYYHFVLRNKKFHHYNRFYLLSAMVISIVIPFLNVPVYFTHEQTNSSVLLHGLTVFSFSDLDEKSAQIISAPARMNFFTWENVLYSFYILIGFLILLRVFFSLKKIRTIAKNNPVEEIENIHFVNTDEPGTPFSFFRWLFWNRKIELRSEKGEQVFRHELFHIEQKHSWDILFIEMLTVIFWINPFFHLIKKELKAIHEFLADEFAVKENARWEYAELLLMQAFNTQINLTNPFFHNQIKRRIAMITSSNKPKYQYLRKILVLPIAAIVVALFAFSYKMKNADKVNAAGKSITVVIDAGHGGSDRGAIASDGTSEKDIVLAIAQKVKSLNRDENVKIILTRNADVLPDLKSRTELSNNEHADLFLSLHVNTAIVKGTTGKKLTGVDIYIPKKNKTFYSENRILGSILLNYFSKLYAVNNSIQQGNNIWVLENNNCPSALIECGFISNNKDLSFMKDPNNQEKIANVILQTIDQYAMQKGSDDWEMRKKGVIDTISVFSSLAQTSRNTIFYDAKNKFSLQADSIILKSDPNNLHTDYKTALLIINGEKKKFNLLVGKSVIVKTVSVYPTNDNETIKKFGAEARNGVIVFENARIGNVDKIGNSISDTIKPNSKPNSKVEEVKEKRLPELVAVAYLPTKIKPDISLQRNVQPLSGVQAGSTEWKKYFSRNINPDDPISEGWQKGVYTLLIRFAVNNDGRISEIQAMNFENSLTAKNSINIFKHISKIITEKDNSNNAKTYYTQPLTFVIIGENENPTQPKIIRETTHKDTLPAGLMSYEHSLIVAKDVEKTGLTLGQANSKLDNENIGLLKVKYEKPYSILPLPIISVILISGSLMAQHQILQFILKPLLRDLQINRVFPCQNPG